MRSRTALMPGVASGAAPSCRNRRIPREPVFLQGGLKVVLCALPYGSECLLRCVHRVPCTGLSVNFGGCALLKVDPGMRVEYVATNKLAEDSTYGHIGGKVLQTCDSCCRHRSGGAVSQKLHPRLRIL